MSYQHDDAILKVATYIVDTHYLKPGIERDPALRYELIQWKYHQIGDLLDSLLSDLEQYSA